MNETRFQHLSDAFNSIISMLLAALRARGLRGLLDLPNMIIAAIYLRRLGREFAALIASLSSLDLSALPPPAPALPPAMPALPDHPAAPAQPASSARPRPRLVASSDAPAQALAEPVAAPPTTTARRPRHSRHAHHQAFARPRHAPDPRAIIALPANLRDPDRTS